MSEHRVDVQCAAGGGRAGDRAEIAHSIAALISIRPIDRICSVYIDEEKNSALEFVLDDFNVIVCERAKQACRVCVEGVVVAAAADNVIEGACPVPGSWPEHAQQGVLLALQNVVEFFPLERHSETRIDYIAVSAMRPVCGTRITLARRGSCRGYVEGALLGGALGFQPRHALFRALAEGVVLGDTKALERQPCKMKHFLVG
jgi:hypothetical protein